MYKAKRKQHKLVQTCLKESKRHETFRKAPCQDFYCTLMTFILALWNLSSIFLLMTQTSYLHTKIFNH